MIYKFAVNISPGPMLTMYVNGLTTDDIVLQGDEIWEIQDYYDEVTNEFGHNERSAEMFQTFLKTVWNRVAARRGSKTTDDCTKDMVSDYEIAQRNGDTSSKKFNNGKLAAMAYSAAWSQTLRDKIQAAKVKETHDFPWDPYGDDY